MIDVLFLLGALALTVLGGARLLVGAARGSSATQEPASATTPSTTTGCATTGGAGHPKK